MAKTEAELMTGEWPGPPVFDSLTQKRNAPASESKKKTSNVNISKVVCPIGCVYSPENLGGVNKKPERNS